MELPDPGSIEERVIRVASARQQPQPKGGVGVLEKQVCCRQPGSVCLSVEACVTWKENAASRQDIKTKQFKVYIKTQHREDYSSTQNSHKL